MTTYTSRHNSSNSKSGSSEDALRASFVSRYHRKIKEATTSMAWQRYEREIQGRESESSVERAASPKTPQQIVWKDMDGAQDHETPKEKAYDPHKVLGIPRATFRGLVIGMSCLIGATLFVILRPRPISEAKEKSNMHYFAKLNADPNIHVTYSGLMYRILEQTELEAEETDINLLTNPNLDIHCVNIEYEGRFVDGTVFDDSAMSGNQEGCTFPAKSLIPGLHQGISNMTRDSVFEFYLPPHLAYGERGSEFIPPHEPLIFKVKLNDFWKDQDLDRPRRFKLVN
eukprot:CAMPEP_0197050444 /NCGR_PEP_ID=MMETSP1384-20130603/25330_1 /TAXON_ID=29189 /ORGANISM="Ammonia sp." /LENGTH=284 /DNA_ID=CAMNT_0042482847 /DNA_START=637 /DNA_END=1491 /DNA_ORIENTATION=+